MDGRMSAVNVQNKGKLLWSIQADARPLLSSSISNIELSRNSVPTKLIPSLDGGLYLYDGSNIEPLLISSESLLSSTSKLNEDTMMIGGKEIHNYGVDANNGKLRYACTLNGCQLFGSTAEVTEDEDLIVITRNTQTVKAVDSRTGLEKWNFSVGSHELNYVGSSKNELTENQDKDDVSSDGCLSPGEPEESIEFSEIDCSLKVIVPDGVVVALNPEDSSSILWQKKFSSPIASIWLLHKGNLKSIDIFNKKYIPALSDAKNLDSNSPLLYLGSHQNQLYVQSSAHFREKLKQHQELQNRNTGPSSIPQQVKWRPYLATAISRTPFLRGNIKNHIPLIDHDKFKDEDTAVTVWNENYPFDNGYYIFPDIAQYKNSLPAKENHSVLHAVLPMSLWNWWKEVAAISILTSVIVHIILTKYQAKHNQEVKALQENDDAKKSSIAQGKERERQDSTESIPAEYVSKYNTDFEHVQNLSRGGFGIVFEARNKVDDCHYAVKRICLPKSEIAKEKVMREVKTLAKLDHPGIVRYFHSWFECPPSGWQEDRDKDFDDSELISQNPCNTGTDQNVNRQLVANPFRLDDQCNQSCSESQIVELTDENNACLYNKDESGSYSCEMLPSSKPDKLTENQEDSLEIIFQNSNQDDVNIPFSTHKQESMSLDATNSFSILNDSGCEKTSSEDASHTHHKHTPSESKSSLQRKSSTKDSKPCLQRSQKMYLYIQMQLCKRETLKDWLLDNTLQRDLDVALDNFDQIVTAVQYVHESGLMHRDLKPSNIFFSLDGIIKVGDFGLATAMGEEIESSDEMNTLSTTPMKKHTGGVGTNLYMSPEQIAGKPYSHKVDIFSLGMILFELLYPFKTEMERRQTLLEVKKNNFTDDLKREIKDGYIMVKQLLSLNPDERPSANEILEWELLTNFAYTRIPKRFRSRTLSASSSIGSQLAT